MTVCFCCSEWTDELDETLTFLINEACDEYFETIKDDVVMVS